MLAKTLPIWAIVALALSVVFMLVSISLLLSSGLAAPATTKPTLIGQTPTETVAELRRQPNYQQRLSVLSREADNATKTQSQHLTILLGDSITQFFPPEMLPPGRSWLNQGIAGDTTAGVLERLQVFGRTQPETIFVLIGTNDLSQGIDDKTILANQQQTIHDLRRNHPSSQIVVQSILPRQDEPKLPWSDRKYGRIQHLNQQLQAMTKASGVNYLNLYPLFVDSQGSIRPELTTDGLHLSSQGYLVWRSALQLYSQLELEPAKSGG